MMLDVSDVVAGAQQKAEADESAAALAAEIANMYESLEAPPDAHLYEFEDQFEQLFAEVPLSLAKQTSRREKERHNFTSSTLTYGEVLFAPFVRLLDKVRLYGGMQEPGGVFVDIGAGSGKPVFAAALLHDFKRCLGIELLEGVYTLANRVLSRWHATVKHDLPERKRDTEITFLHADSLMVDWDDADIVFANATCFDDELMEAIAAKACRLKPGAFFLTTTRELPNRVDFTVLEQGKLTQGWGDSTYFIHRRL